MKNATMLYKSPGAHTTDGISYDYTIVDADEVEATLADGWHLTYVEAAQANLAANEKALAEVEKKLADAKSTGDRNTAIGHAAMQNLAKPKKVKG